MDEKEFERWYERIKEEVDECNSEKFRMAIIAGFFRRISKDTFTGEQVSMILALRYPE